MYSSPNSYGVYDSGSTPFLARFAAISLVTVGLVCLGHATLPDESERERVAESRVEQMLERYDTDENGVITPSELQAYFESH